MVSSACISSKIYKISDTTGDLGAGMLLRSLKLNGGKRLNECGRMNMCV